MERFDMTDDEVGEDRRRHNEWVQEVASGIDFEPLREFVLRLAEEDTLGD
jgi:hypothetical protein